MMKFSFKMLVLIVILISTNICAKSNQKYYDVKTKECRIAIPVEFFISKAFSKDRITFFQQKDLLGTYFIEIKNKNVIKDINTIKKVYNDDNDILLEEKKLGNLLYMKFKVHIANNANDYEHFIFGKDFVWHSINVKQKDIDHMIKHCNETYNEESNTSK